jgi:hypothetical protein
MGGRAIKAFLVVAFAVAVGHLAWTAVFGPPVVPDYFIGGQVYALKGTNPEHKTLYLRRKLFLPQQPRAAWLQVLAQDRVQIYINEKRLASQFQDGFTVAILSDITPFLKHGPNIIAIAVQQYRVNEPPVVAVDGAYTDSFGVHTFGSADQLHVQPVNPSYANGDIEYSVASDDFWRCSDSFERRGLWWFEFGFHDRHWPPAEVSPAYLRGRVDAPPGAAKAPRIGQWITPPWQNGSGGIRKEFEIAGRPRQAWLRVTALTSYVLGVNGNLIDQQEAQLGTPQRNILPGMHIYDLTQALQSGHNVISLMVTQLGGPPHALVEMEIEDANGQFQRVVSDGTWLGRAGLCSDWLKTAPDSPSKWETCRVETGDLNVLPWQPVRTLVAVTLPFAVMVQNYGLQLLLTIVIGLATYLACRVAGRVLVRLAGGASGPALPSIVYLALLPTTLAIGGGVVSTYDPRVARQDIYQEMWLYVAVAAVPLQWLLLGLTAVVYPARRTQREEAAASSPEVSSPSPGRALALRLGVLAFLTVCVGVGYWLRVRDIGSEPLDGDETAEVYEARGLLESGVPSIVITSGEFRDALPRKEICTSELIYPALALSSLTFDDPAWIIRFPSVVFGVLNILLIFMLGRRMFGTATGLVAAALYTVAPLSIQVANFGRYFTQLQFLTLVTLHFFWMTIRGTGPINKKALWLTGFGFLGMVLTWEGAGLLAPGMMLAALLQRRGRLRTLLVPSTIAAMAFCGSVVLLQQAHRNLIMAELPVYGADHDDLRLKLTPMWYYPHYFQPLYYLWNSSWNRDTFVPLLGLLAAGVLAIRSTIRQPLRLLVFVHVTTCLLMALFLPLITGRYSYNMSTLLILMSAAAAVAIARRLIKLVFERGMPWAWSSYAGLVAGLTVVAVMIYGSGHALALYRWSKNRSPVFQLGLLKFPDVRGPVQYLHDHIEKDDIVLTNMPPVVDHLMDVLLAKDKKQNGELPKWVKKGRGEDSGGDWKVDYWLQSKLFLVAVLDDQRDQPLHRRTGEVMLTSIEQLEDLFARHRRIWYVVMPGMMQLQNDAGVQAFLRQNMEMVSEDNGGFLLFRGDNHWPAFNRYSNEDILQKSQAPYFRDRSLP